MGNPPYDQERQGQEGEGEQRKGGWIRHGDPEAQEQIVREAPLEDFLRDARENGFGEHVKTLYNDYVYFWRWALWKMFDNPDSRGPGIVSFITSSKYLRGPGFVGMRKKIREAFDDLWIIDLEGDNIGARKTENIFAIQTPVAIAVGVRNSEDRPHHPANVHYTKITGTATEKLQFLSRINNFDDLEWQECSNDWLAPLLPRIAGNYSDWPEITSLFPWQHSGMQWSRTWPYGVTVNCLENRWRALLSAPDEQTKRNLFCETKRANGAPIRVLDREYDDIREDRRLSSILTLDENTPCITPEKIGFRSFDRQYAIPDNRLGDLTRPVLWKTLSAQQVFFGSLLTEPLGLGPAISVSAYVPDLNYFCGRGGQTIPLYRDGEGNEPNITTGLLDYLSQELGITVTAEDLAAYLYAIMSAPEYVETYSEELVIPSPRIPISRNPDIFSEAVRHGRHLIFLHTFGERFLPQDGVIGQIPQGIARCVRNIPHTEAGYPEDFSYNAERQTLIVGSGEIAPVSRATWDFSISDFKVLHSWLSYRKRDGAGRRNSPLNDIRPTRWTMEMTTELLNLIWILEGTIANQPTLNELLHRISAQSCFTSNELPVPTEEERREPRSTRQRGPRNRNDGHDQQQRLFD